MTTFQAIRYHAGQLRLIDQRKLPLVQEWIECQRQYNRMLTKHIQRMRAEIRMLRRGETTGVELDKPVKTAGEWKQEIKTLNVESWSLKSENQAFLIINRAWR